MNLDENNIINEIIRKLHKYEYNQDDIKAFLNKINEFKLEKIPYTSRLRNEFELKIKQEYWRCKFIIQIKKSIEEGLPPTNINSFYEEKLGGVYYSQTNWASVDNIKYFFDIENLIKALKEYCIKKYNKIKTAKPEILEKNKVNIDKPLKLLNQCLNSESKINDNEEGLHIFFPQGEKSVQKAKREHFGLKKDYLLSELSLLEEEKVQEVKFDNIARDLEEVRNRKFIGKCKAIFKNKSTVNISIIPFKDFKNEYFKKINENNYGIIDKFLFFKYNNINTEIRKNNKKLIDSFDSSVYFIIQDKQEKNILLKNANRLASGEYILNNEKFIYKFIKPLFLLKIENEKLFVYIRIMFNEFVKNNFIEENITIFNKQFYLKKEDINYDNDDDYYYIEIKYGNISEIILGTNDSNDKSIILTKNYYKIGEDFKKKTLYVLSKTGNFYTILPQQHFINKKIPELKIISNEPIILELSDNNITILDEENFKNKFFEYKCIKQKEGTKTIYYYNLKIKKLELKYINIKTSQLGDKHQLIFDSTKDYKIKGNKCDAYLNEQHTHISSVEIYPRLIEFTEEEEKLIESQGWKKNFDFEKKTTFFSTQDKKIYSKEISVKEVPFVEIELENIEFNKTEISISCSSNNFFKVEGKNIDIDKDEYMNIHKITIKDSEHTIYIKYKTIANKFELKKAPFIEIRNIINKKKLLEQDIKNGKISFYKNYFENKIHELKTNKIKYDPNKINFKDLINGNEIIINISFRIKKKLFEIHKNLQFYKLPKIEVEQRNNSIYIKSVGKNNFKLIIYDINNPFKPLKDEELFVDNEKIISIKDLSFNNNSNYKLSIIDPITEFKKELKLIPPKIDMTKNINQDLNQITNLNHETNIKDKVYLRKIQYLLLYVINENVTYDKIKKNLPYYGLNNYEFSLEINKLITMNLIGKFGEQYLVTPKGKRILSLNENINSLITNLAFSIKFCTSKEKLFEIKKEFKNILDNKKIKSQ